MLLNERHDGTGVLDVTWLGIVGSVWLRWAGSGRVGLERHGDKAAIATGPVGFHLSCRINPKLCDKPSPGKKRPIHAVWDLDEIPEIGH